MKLSVCLMLIIGLSGCSSFWESYGKRSELTIGYSANNVGATDRNGERNYNANATIRGSNNAVNRIFESMTTFSMKELGLK